MPESTHTTLASASGFDRVAPKPTDKLGTGAAGSKPLAEGPSRAHEKTGGVCETRPFLGANSRSRRAQGQFQNFDSASPADVSPPAAGASGGGWRRAPPRPISTLKSECGGETVAPHRGPGFAARRSAPARPRIKWLVTQPEMPESTHATMPLGQRFRSGRAEAYPIARHRRRQIETAGRGALARARENGRGMRNAVRRMTIVRGNWIGCTEQQCHS